jgi:hypothetical protein
VLVIILNDLIKEILEGDVGIGRTGIAANARVHIFATREDASLERDTASVFFIMVLVPDLLSEMFGKQRLGSLGELRPVDEIIRGFEMITDQCSLGRGLRDTLGSVAAHGFIFLNYIDLSSYKEKRA